VRQAIADAVSPLIRCSPVLGPVVAPCAMVRRDERDPRFVFGGAKAEQPMTILFFHSRSSDRAAQETFAELAEQSGVTSVKATLESNAALEALGEAIEVVRIGSEQIAEVSGVEYVTFEIELKVVF
jgi:hypothetical protein